MNKNIKLAVAGAVLALSATAANAGIVIPAGDWTLDVSGNVNAYDIYSRAKGTATVAGGFATGSGKASSAVSSSGMQNGLLPNFLSIGATTRQNDLDVSFLISLQPGTGNNTGLTQVGSSGNAGLNNRQAYLTFGDKSWGSVKLGKDLGIFASDAILNDMTLLGVGATLGNSTSGGNTTLGRIGTGFIYADWKPQIAYTTPNFNGFQATVGISQAFTAASLANVAAKTTTTWSGNTPTNTYVAPVNYSLTGTAQSNPAYEGKASYSFASNDVTGKVWVSGMSQKANVGTAFDSVMYAADIGAHIDVAGFGLTGYYYGGSGVGTTVQGWDGYALSGQQRDSDGGYVQATYVLPTKTKVGLSWGQSNLDLASGETNANLVKTNEMWTVGVYHPLTKHLNLVAEYSYMTSTNQANQDNNVNVGDVGAILFF